MSLSKGDKNGKIFEPNRILRAEGLKSFFEIAACPGLENFEGASEQVSLKGGNRLEIDRALREIRNRLNVGVVKEILLQQLCGADQERIAGECGETLVGRPPVSQGSQGKHCPDALPRPLQEVDETVCLGAEVADAVTTGERGGMKKNSALSRKTGVTVVTRRVLGHAG